MKKLTLKDLQSLAHTMEHVSETEQRCFVGGGTGGNLDPFTYKEYENMLNGGTWNGGFVLMDGRDGSDSSMQYIPSSSFGTDEDLVCETFDSQMSLYENHQIMTMALGNTGNDGGTVPSGYWTDSGYWTGSGYINGYYDESGVWISSGYLNNSGIWIDSGAYNPEEDCYDKSGYFPEITVWPEDDPYSFFTFQGLAKDVRIVYSNGNITYDLNSLPTIPNDTWDTMYKGGFEIGFKAGISSIPSFFVDLYAMVNYAVAEEDWSTFYYAKGLQDGLNMGRNAYEHFR